MVPRRTTHVALRACASLNLTADPMLDMMKQCMMAMMNSNNGGNRISMGGSRDEGAINIFGQKRLQLGNGGNGGGDGSGEMNIVGQKRLQLGNHGKGGGDDGDGGEMKLRFPTPSKKELPPLPTHAPKVAEVAGLGDEGSDDDDDGAGMAGIADHILEKIKGRAKGKAAPKAKGKAAPKAKGKAAPKATGKAAPKEKGKAAPKAKGKAAPKAKGKATPKEKGKAAPKAGGGKKKKDSSITTEWSRHQVRARTPGGSKSFAFKGEDNGPALVLANAWVKTQGYK